MSVLLSLSPFLVFFVLMRSGSPLAGLGGALATSVLLCLAMRVRGRSVKILEIGSLVVFGLLTAYTVAAAPRWTVATVRLAVDAGLLGIVLVSLAIGRPFTIQYAREQVPEVFWASPVFLSVNRAITWAWAGAFAVMVAADVSAEWVTAIPISVDVVASVAAFAAAVGFSRWYPAKVRRAVAAALGTGSTPA
jgi:intracellular septation protein A